MMDPVSGAAVIVGLQKFGEPAAELVKDFLGRILAPTGDALGQALAQPIVEWQKRRVERASKLVREAAAAVAESGQEPQPVPGRLLFPILERGSLEEDDELHQRWVSLLANSALSPYDILPSFVTILGELSPAEANVLHQLHQIAVESNWANLAVGREFYLRQKEQWGSLEERAELRVISSRMGHVSPAQMDVVVANLKRLALVERDGAHPSVVRLRLTPFGAAFIRACSADPPPPAPQAM
jgi:abortive infection alpha-like protein